MREMFCLRDFFIRCISSHISAPNGFRTASRLYQLQSLPLCLFMGYPFIMYTTAQKKRYASKLRKNQTKAERRLWPLYLVGFRPQQITPSGYIADWYNAASKICVEADGGIHSLYIARDKARDSHHRKKKILTIRVPNQYVLGHARWLMIITIILLSIGWQLRLWFKLT